MSRNKWTACLASTLTLTLTLALATHSSASDQPVSFQARLTVLNGQPLPDSVDLQFDVYRLPTGGNPVNGDPIVVQGSNVNGVVAAMPFMDPQWFDGTPRFLEVRVNGEVLEPRIELGAVPYALAAIRVVPSDLVPGNSAQPGIYVTSDEPNQTNLQVGGIQTGVTNRVIINAPNAPIDHVGAEVQFAFASGGSARINAYRGGSWDTGLQFFTNEVDQGSDSPIKRMEIQPDGRVIVSERLAVGGNTRTATLTIVGGSDLAERFDVREADGSLADGAGSDAGSSSVRPGAIVSIDPTHPGGLIVSSEPYDAKVAGVISGANGLATGLVMGADDDPLASGGHSVALTGRVWVLATTVNGPIRIGDRLTSSPLAGHAMKVADEGRAAGAVIGKAMTELNEDSGYVLVLLQPQ